MDKLFWVLAIVGMLYMCTGGDDEEEVVHGTGGGGGPTQLEAEAPIEPESPAPNVRVEKTDNGFSITIGKSGGEEIEEHAGSGEETEEDLTIGETPKPKTNWRESW